MDAAAQGANGDVKRIQNVACLVYELSFLIAKRSPAVQKEA